jgi:hypothetical protein
MMEVEHHKVGSFAQNEWPQLPLTRGGADHLKVGFGSDGRLESLEDRGVVIEQRDANGAAHAAVRSRT